MRFHHNFVILDIECLTNLKGILAYIAERVQLGKLCLSCDKQFKTASRAQQHMIDLGHCMMPFDKDEEFENFYDFSRAYREFVQKPMITEAGEVSNEINEDEERKIERNQRAATGEEKKAGAAEEPEQAEEGMPEKVIINTVVKAKLPPKKKMIESYLWSFLKSG